MDYQKIKDIAVQIFNASFDIVNKDLSVNQKLRIYENSTFENDENVQKLLDNELDYNSALSLVDDDCDVLNLKWLKSLKFDDDMNITRQKYSLLYPIKTIVIAEGITEEILLPVFANLLGYNFDQNGIQILSAGGKNQVVKMFYQYVEELKIPIFVLLDNDAKPNSLEIVPRLRNCDKIHLLEHGEFEDALPVKLIERTLKYATENISELPITHPDSSDRMVHYLEDFFKKRGTHEFKKAEFALMVKENICGLEDISDEFKKVIEELKAL